MFDLRRAQEWTAALTAGASRSPTWSRSVATACLPRRADAIPWGLEDATDEAQRAREWLSRPPPEPAVGEAIYQLAELDRLRGAFESAEAGYREARRLGSPAGARPRAAAPGAGRRRRGSGRDPACAWPRRATTSPVRGCSSQPVEIALAAGDVATRARRGRSTRCDRRAGSMRRCSARWPLASRWRRSARGRRRRGRAGRPAPGVGGLARRSTPRTRRPRAGPDRRAPVASWATSTAPTLETAAAREVFERLGAAPDLARLEAPIGPARRRPRRRPEHARGRGPAARRRRADQPGDRRGPDDQRTDRRPARQQHLHEARRVDPRSRDGLRLRARPRLTEVPIRPLARFG